jgi:predicted DNA-binding transcriptional regulator YafY
MPVNKNQFLRFQRLNTLLKKNKGYTIPELTQIVNDKLADKGLESVTTRTIYSDLKSIETTFEIEIKKQGKRYKYANPKDSINDSKANQEEQKIVKEGLELFTSALQNIPLVEKFNDVIQRLLSGDVFEKINDQDSTRVIQIGEYYNKSGFEYLERIYKAIKEKRPIKAHYQKSTQETNWRIISPYILKEYRNQWYLVGFSRDSSRGGSSSVYALSKIISLQAAEKNVFEIDPDFNAEDYFKYSLGVFHSLYNPPILVKLKFLGTYWVQHWKNQKIHQTMEILEMKEDEVTLSVMVYHTPELESMILNYGANVMIMEPSELREKVKSLIGNMANLYKSL